MSYVLTEHARDAMAKRSIRLEWLERTLAHPDWCESDEMDAQPEHRLAAIAEFGNRAFRFIVNVVAEPDRVATMYFDRNVRGGR